jgi:predicted RND superfamily exporter protein
MFLARPRLALAALALLAAGLLYVALRFASYDTAPDTVVDPATPAFQHEVDYESVFGADPLVILVSGDVEHLFNGPGLTSEIALEAGLAQHPDLGVQSVYGPSSIATVAGATIQNVAAGQLTTVVTAAEQKAQLDAKAAGKSDQEAQQAGQQAGQDAGKAYIANALKQFPELQKLAPLQANNPKWMDALFINPDNGKPKARFAAVTPDPNHVVVTARLRPETGQGAVTVLVNYLRQTVKGTPIEKAVTISGVPVLEAVIARGLRLSLFAGMLLGVISMAVLLLVALRRRGRLVLRILPLVAGLGTVFLLAGLVTAIGLGAVAIRSRLGTDSANLQSILATITLALNPATLAAFPIALGLSVDYAVQFLYRYSQGVEGSIDDPWQVARRGAGLATRRAAICTVAGLLALLISSIPMVRQFGVVMSLGVVIAWVVARLTVLAAVRAWPGLGLARSVAVAAKVEVETVAEDVDSMLFGLGAGAPTATRVANEAGAVSEPAVSVEPEPVASPPPEWEPTPWDVGPEAIPELGPRLAYSRAILEPAVAVEESPTVPFFTARSDEVHTEVHAVHDGAPNDVGPSNDGSAPDDEGAPDDQDDAPIRTPGWLPAALAQFARRHTTAILAPALLLAMVGWAALPFSSYESDPEKLVSPNLPALHDLNVVRQATGSAGELDFILTGPDVASPTALTWIRNLQSVAQRDSNGRLKPLASISDLVTQVNGGKEPTAEQVQSYLRVMPTYFTDALLDRSHRIARVAFGINLSPVTEQKQIIDRILADVDPPAGYNYYPAGFNYLTVRGLESLQSGQLVINAVGAVLVLLLLFAIYRRRRLALMAWAPTLLVAGWSTAVLFALRVPLTPLTAVLGALVVAFGTEFAILWLERYREALADGFPSGAEAAEAASRAAGPGIMLSGGALALGFVALAAGALPGVSRLGFDLPVVRDFGLVATMDMVLAVAGALVVLPAIVVRLGLAEKAPAGLASEGRVAPADAAA